MWSFYFYIKKEGEKMLNAVITKKPDGCPLLIGFPCKVIDLCSSLQAVGIMNTPNSINIADAEDSNISVKLYANNNFGQALIPLFSSSDTLADVNTITSLIERLPESLKESIEPDVLYGQYENKEQLLEDIKGFPFDNEDAPSETLGIAIKMGGM